MNPREENIKELIFHYVAGECSTSEESSVRAWINESDDNRLFYFETKMAWNRALNKQNPYKIDTEAHWQKVKNRFGPGFKIDFRSLSNIAAIVTISCLLGFFTYWLVQKRIFNENAIVYHEVIAPYGSKTQLTLNDGSQVWLNSGSTLKYPSSFSGEFRQVFLKGEAFFDVFTDKSTPFVVNANNLKVKAYGTKFNVKAYPEEDFVETTLVEGIVSLKVKDSKDEVFLEKNQKAFVAKKTNKINLTSKESKKGNLPGSQTPKAQVLKKLKKSPLYIEKDIATELSTSWKEGEWIFKETAIEDLAKILERRYNVTIIFHTKETGYLTFTGTLRDETLKMALDALMLISPIRYKMNGSHIEIYEDSARKKEYLKHLNNY